MKNVNRNDEMLGEGNDRKKKKDEKGFEDKGRSGLGRESTGKRI